MEYYEEKDVKLVETMSEVVSEAWARVDAVMSRCREEMTKEEQDAADAETMEICDSIGDEDTANQVVLLATIMGTPELRARAEKAIEAYQEAD